MKYIFLFVLISLSCRHKSELKHERGFVVEKQFTPSGDGTTVGYAATQNGGGVVVGSTHFDEKYMIVFKCEHQVVFSINNQALYAKLNKGDTVRIDYYNIENRKGDIKDFEFVDANLEK